MRISAHFTDVPCNFEYHTDFQDLELKRENVAFNDGFNGGCEKHIKT